MHQAIGTNRKCSDTRRLSQSVSLTTTVTNQKTQLEIMPNFYALHYILFARKICINLLSEKLLVKCWWNWSPEVNLTNNILLTAFTHEDPKSAKKQSSHQSYLLIRDLGSQKLLLERWWNWPPRLNFIIVLPTAFTCADPESVKRLTTWLLFYAFGLRELKSCM